MFGGISVSDADFDDLAGRMRVRVRRKRRRPEIRLRPAVARWRPIALFFPALALLTYQASKIWAKPAASSLDPVVEDAAVSTEELPGNLDRLDARTRVVNGVREPCLKLLSKKIFPVLSYLPLRRGYCTNLFWEIKHLSNEKTVLSENGGFRVSEEDKGYMNTCSAVVSTCAFGGGDDLYQPIWMVEESLSKVCYVAFWDEIIVSAQEANGIRKREDHMIGKWRIVVVRNLPFSDQRLNGKIPKMFSHRIFRQARYSIWVDSKSMFEEIQWEC